MPLSIEQAIAKYSGGDDAYALKLKSGIRDAMGYSNYKAKMMGAIEAPVDTGSVKGMDPATIAAHRSSVMNQNQGDINTYGKITGEIDQAAGSLASAQAAREKAAASDKQKLEGMQNGVAFQPKDELDQMILAYQQNPKNADGSIKSLQQFEAETNAKFGKDMFGSGSDSVVAGTGEVPKYTLDDVKNRIAERVPKDFIGNEDKYSLMSQGFSEKQAKEFQGALRYDTMSQPEKLIYQVTHPEMAKKIESGMMNKDLINDVTSTITTQDGRQQPQYTVEQLKEKYPNISDADLKSVVTPIERKGLMDDISQKLSEPSYKDAIVTAMKDPAMGFKAVMEGDNYKKLKTDLKMQYGSVFNDTEIDQMMYGFITNSLL